MNKHAWLVLWDRVDMDKKYYQLIIWGKKRKLSDEASRKFVKKVWDADALRLIRAAKTKLQVKVVFNLCRKGSEAQKLALRRLHKLV